MPAEQSDKERESIPFYPDHLRSELKVIGGLLLLMVFVGALGLMAPIGLGPPADPLDTPAHVKPEWYFLALYQILKYVSKTVGVLLPLAGVAVLLFWPFLSRAEGATRQTMRRRGLLVAILLFVFIILTVWGEVS